MLLRTRRVQPSTHHASIFRRKSAALAITSRARRLISARIGDVVAKLAPAVCSLHEPSDCCRPPGRGRGGRPASYDLGGLQQGAAAVAERLEAERKRLVTHAGALRVLLGEIAQAKSSEADIRKALHVLRKQQSTDCRKRTERNCLH